MGVGANACSGPYALDAVATLLDAVTALIDWAGTHHDGIHANRAHFDTSGIPNSPGAKAS